jgi:hypothetical protein
VKRVLFIQTIYSIFSKLEVVKVEIKHKLLTDSAYDGSNKELFLSFHEDLNDIRDDIIYGNSTCYLITGYRGAGKSSFVKKLEEELKPITTPNPDNEINKTTKDLKKEVVFVYLTISKYHPPTHLLRKLIRGFYLKIKELKSFEEQESKEKVGNLKKPANQLASLFDQTFNESVKSNSSSKFVDHSNELIIDKVKLFSYGLLTVFFILVFFSSNGAFEIGLANILGLLFSLMKLIESFLGYKFTKNTTVSTKEENNRKSMYDDDIAEYHFYNVLESFDEIYKVVFVLDELDKMEEKVAEDQINDIKPYLVSGKASFILVSGQALFYKYLEAKRKDDALLSSIFSKIIHIPLMSREEFKLLFNRLCVNPNETLYNGYVDHFIYQSKRIPRKFMNLLRNDMIRENGKAYLEIDDNPQKYSKFTKILNSIDKVDDTEIASQDLDDGLRDFFVMQLYIGSHNVFSANITKFTVEQLKTHHGEEIHL